jgi:pimeloyl-ACP methyl ester carboxylesterase
MNEVQLPQGTVRYRDAGSGPPIVFAHGVIVDGRLWDGVVGELSGEFRCIVPDLPLGAHEVPLAAHAERTPAGVARLIADFIEALDLTDVTLVGNDTGGALSQIVATRHPERLGALVLTSCDIYEDFLPPLFKPLQFLARIPGGLKAIAVPLQWRPLRRTPPAFGWLMKHPIDPAVEADWIRRFLADAGVRRDASELVAAIDPAYTLRAAEDLPRFGKPVLLIWAAEDKVFKPAHAKRLAAAIPGARLEMVEDSYSFVPVDQPRRTAELIREFVRESQPSRAN